MVQSHYFLSLSHVTKKEDRECLYLAINSPQQPCNVTESQGDKHIDVESGAGSAEGGDQGEEGGGDQEETERHQGQEDGHLVYSGVEYHVPKVDTVCIICPASI